MKKLCCVIALGIVGCQSEGEFVDDGPVDFALTMNTPPLVMTDEAALYIVEHRVELPVRDPGDAVMAARIEGASQYENLPFDRLPWVDRDDMAIEINYTVSNMDNAPHDLVTVTVNGINEFDEYVPSFTVDRDNIIVDYSGWERSHKLEPLEREQWTVRENEMDEVAVDLATVVNGAPNSNQIVYFQNHSSTDARSQMYIPPVVPGLIGVRLGIRTLEEANIVLEASVRVRQKNTRLVEGDQALLEVTPEQFRPVAPMTEE